MREKKYHVYLSDEEYRLILHSLMDYRNQLIRDGKYTDVVDDLLIKMSKRKKKKLKVI